MECRRDDLAAVVLSSSREQLALERLASCGECRHQVETFGLKRCQLCSCFLELKTRVLSESCPIARWSSAAPGVLESLRDLFR